MDEVSLAAIVLQSSTPPQRLLRSVAGTLEPSRASRVSWYYVSFPDNRRRKMSCAAVKAASRLGSVRPFQKEKMYRNGNFKQLELLFRAVITLQERRAASYQWMCVFFVRRFLGLSMSDNVKAGAPHSLCCLAVLF